MIRHQVIRATQMTASRAARLQELIDTTPPLQKWKRKPQTIKVARVRVPGPSRPPRPPAVLPITVEAPPATTRKPRTIRIAVGVLLPVKPPPPPAVIPIDVRIPPPRRRRPRTLKIAVGVDGTPPLVRPEKPYADFPLRPHAAGNWVYLAGRGRYVYFGRWHDPETRLREGTLSQVDPTGRMWRRALAKFEVWQREQNVQHLPVVG